MAQQCEPSEYQMRYDSLHSTISSLEPGALVQIIKAYKKAQAEELNLEVGDVVTLLEVSDKGWWRGVKNLESGAPEMGWFPSAAAQELSEDSLMAPVPVPVSREISRRPSSISFPSVEQSPTPQSITPKDSQKRTRSGSWYQKVFTKTPSSASIKPADKKSKRERSMSVPSTTDNLACSPLSFTTAPDILPTIDSSIATLNKTTSKADLKKVQPSTIGNLISPSKVDVFKKQFSLKTFPSPAASQPRSKFNPAFKELVDTEWNYLQDLKLFDYLKILMTRLQITSDKGIKTLYSNLDQIIKLHQNLLEDLDTVLFSFSPINSLSSIFEPRMEQFLLYTSFASNVSMSQSKVKRMLKQKPQFREFLKVLNSLPRTRGLSLEAFMISPVQRICRYPLLLKEIIQKCESDNEKQELQSTFEKMEKVVSMVNDSMAQARLKKNQRNSFSFSEDGRSKLRDDKVTVVSKGRKKKRYLNLYNNSIIMAKKSWTGRWTLVFDVPLSESSLKIKDGDKSEDLLICIKSSIFSVSFASSHAKKNWEKMYSSLADNYSPLKDRANLELFICNDGLEDGSDASDSDGSEDGTVTTSRIVSYDNIQDYLIGADFSTHIANEYSVINDTIQEASKNASLDEGLEKDSPTTVLQSDLELDAFTQTQSYLEANIKKLQEEIDCLVSEKARIFEELQVSQQEYQELEKACDGLKEEHASRCLETETLLHQKEELIQKLITKIDDLEKQNQALYIQNQTGLSEHEQSGKEREIRLSELEIELTREKQQVSLVLNSLKLKNEEVQDLKCLLEKWQSERIEVVARLQNANSSMEKKICYYQQAIRILKAEKKKSASILSDLKAELINTQQHARNSIASKDMELLRNQRELQLMRERLEKGLELQDENYRKLEKLMLSEKEKAVVTPVLQHGSFPLIVKGKIITEEVVERLIQTVKDLKLSNLQYEKRLEDSNSLVKELYQELILK